ncbi:MAG: cation:proton antiporter [Chloroflexi bacterium]|nr:cation:proton antiporter [Chloroflexota bacterium]MCY4248001.1 cation:proton antiporter [Chloroflexota bacterium]
MDFAVLAISLVSFLFITLAAHRIGQLASFFQLPLITGYLVAGIFAGPFFFHFVASADVDSLRFLDETALAFIAFAAGSEMALDELRGRFRSIGWNTVTQIVAVYLLTGAAIMLLAEQIPFMRDLSTTGKVAAALLGGTILAARSPSSAIAIINEMRARGPFTKTILGVTLVKDVLIVVLFALSTSIAGTLLIGRAFDIGFIILVTFELLASIGLGLLIAQLMGRALRAHWGDELKIALLLFIGYLVFAATAELRAWSYANLPVKLLFEPLLICMVASFWLTNRSPYRSELRHLLHKVRTPIFVIFFTLIGSSLDIGIVLDLLPVTLALFATRIVALFIGAYLGGSLAQDPPQFKRLAWMGYITQAGVALGLAKEVAINFPELGAGFTTLMAGVIVVSELSGPPFFKFAIRLVGESHLPKDIQDDEVLDVVIVGIENQSRQLAERLLEHGWRVKLLDIDQSHVSNAGDNGNRKEQWLPQISPECLAQIIAPKTEVAVALLPNDEDSLKLCQILYEDFGITRQIARLHAYTLVDEFRELGVHVLHPANAMVHLLDHFVRAPQLATIVFEDDPEHDVIQVTITDPNVDGLHLRELILPDDVLVMAIGRRGHSIVPHGYTNLHLEDELTLIGPTDSLEEVALKLGY